MTVYQVAYYEGLGTSDHPYVEHPLRDEVYAKKRNAEQRAYKLYQERLENYRGGMEIMYGVIEVKVK